MSYGAGHAMDAINRLKQNRAQRPSNRAKFKGNNRQAIYATEITQGKPKFKTVPEKELHIVKARIKAKAQKRHKKARLFYIIFSIVLIIGFVYFILLSKSLL